MTTTRDSHSHRYALTVIKDGHPMTRTANTGFGPNTYELRKCDGCTRTAWVNVRDGRPATGTVTR